MATLKQVVDVLETLYPLRYAEQWDEPGLIVGDLRHDVRNIAFAADPSMAVIDQAIAGRHRPADLPPSAVLPFRACGLRTRIPW